MNFDAECGCYAIESVCASCVCAFSGNILGAVVNAAIGICWMIQAKGE